MILVLRALGIGDLATAVPALRGLRSAFPDRTLALAAPAWLAPLVELVGGVDRLVRCDRLDGPDRLPAGGRPDLAVNLHGSGPRSHRLLAAAGPDRLWAFACPAAGHRVGPPWIGDEHEVRRWCRLLAWYGVPTDPAELSLHRPAGSRMPTGTSVVHVGGKDSRRRWSSERFAAVARALDQLGHHVVITGSAADRGIAEYVAERAGLPAPAVLAGRTDLAGLAALVAGGRLVVSTDTGVGHLATGYGTPSVLLFGPEPPRRWGPPPERWWHRVIWHEDRAGLPFDPGRDAIHPALAAIAADDVIEAVAEVDRPAGLGHAAAAR
ncbi:MAG TPA: glycosyltransferase family 9 protein [Micromonosporaceae bacterium]